MLTRILRSLGRLVVSALIVAALLLAGVLAIHQRAVEEEARLWEAHRPAPLGDIGSVDSLSILPLVDWHAERPGLLTDAGVSYLVRAGGFTLLFDTGNHTDEAGPSPLGHNMDALGVSVDDLDAVFISHAHFDHTGGRRWTGGAVTGTTFGIGDSQPALGDRTIVTASPMTYPGAEPLHARDPVRIAPGVATTGTIARKLFGGWIDEQALAIHLRGRGIVLVVGCGHQTIPRLVERAEAVFEQPLYGVVGGLHYPVPEGRLRMGPGVDVQRWLASGSGPLAPITEGDVRAEIALLHERKLGLVAVGGHDSSDEAIGWFRDAFGPAYRELRVGRELRAGP